MLKQVSINVALIEAQEKMSGYAMSMKDKVTMRILVSFRMITECNIVAL